jgi:uncharacterized protein YukE
VSDINTNYDTVQTFDVRPAAMMENVNKVKQYNADINGDLKHIQDIFTGLALGWAGKTKQEASGVMDKWNSVMVELFGTGGGKGEDVTDMTPSQLGVLNFILIGMNGAAEIYATAEVGIEKFYKDFREALASSAAPAQGPTTVDANPEDVTNTHDTAVGESW